MWGMQRSLMWSLGTFDPYLPPEERNYYLRSMKVSDEFAAFMKERCTAMLNHADVRCPDHTFSLLNAPRSTTPDWHHDGSKNGKHCYIAVWSNGIQTEIRDTPGDGTVYQAAPGEVILFHNAYFEHRMPRYVRKVNRVNRWFARCAFPLAGKVKNVDGVFALDLDSSRGPTHPERM